MALEGACEREARRVRHARSTMSRGPIPLVDCGSRHRSQRGGLVASPSQPGRTRPRFRSAFRQLGIALEQHLLPLLLGVQGRAGAEGLVDDSVQRVVRLDQAWVHGEGVVVVGQ